MIVVTVDPAITTYAIVIFQDDQIICSKTYSYSSKLPQEDRLWSMHYNIINELDERKLLPDLIIVERQFVDIMSQCVGVIRATAGYFRCKAKMYAPSSWRKWAFGKGNVSEEIIRQETIKQFPCLIDSSEHEIDAAAFYIAWKNEVNDEGNTKTTSRRRSGSK